MLSCRALRKTYQTDRGPVDAVRGVDLDVSTGRYLAVIGRSGSGKSTLMAMIGGLSRPSAGSILVDGADIWSLGDNAMARFRNKRIGYIFQFASLLPTLRAIDNVALPALLGRDGAPAESYERAARLLTELGLGSHFDAYPSEMSAGEQRRTVDRAGAHQRSGSAAGGRADLRSRRRDRKRDHGAAAERQPRTRDDIDPCHA